MHEESLPTPEPGTWYPVDGLGDTIGERWLRLRQRLGVRDRSNLRELVEAAFAEPRLRALSPGTSVYWLRFSRRAAPPIFGDLPLARALRDGRYEVRTSDGRLQEAASTAAAVSLLVAALPADIPTSP
ncbi:hypothetical protein AVW11_10855 [Streptomyces amritsarensis]|uniref:Uncharacterized protein n=1 Tax=Streptomyces amritsarensis TaxID=681158 RepID=A0ABX3G5B6_9ACTN|nr:DUF6193 family natural product biosynthesis protein [Streptomyces amritsarensis]OLZ69093.1 hypothetical protein AVW11_10855 [Streptomyces amritsarensis]